MSVETAECDAPAFAIPDDYRRVLGAFSEIAFEISEERPLDELLHVIAARICSLLGIRRCSVYLKDQKTGFFLGQVAEVGADVDKRIKRLTAGIEADGFTREIVESKRPVLIRNAKYDPRPVRAVMRDWDVQTILGVPMVLRGEVVGILFLDNEDQPHDYTLAEQNLSAVFANLAAIAISQAQLMSGLRSTLRTVEQQNTLLRRAATVEDRMTKLVLDGADLREIAQAVTELTGKPCAIHDASLRCVASGAPRSSAGGDSLPAALRRAEVVEALKGVEHRAPEVVGPFSVAGVQRRFLVAPVSVGDEPWGTLVLAEDGQHFGPRDMIVARRTATVIALELTAARRASEGESRALEALARDLVNGSDESAALVRRADFHGVALAEPHLVCLLCRRDETRGSRLSVNAIASAFERAAPDLRALVAGVDKGAAVILELPAARSTTEGVRRAKLVAAQVVDELAADVAVTAAISHVCRSVDDYSDAYEQARQVSHCISTFAAPDTSVLAADDFGAGRLLLATASREEADHFVSDTLDVLLEDPAHHHLLDTVNAFFATSRSVRAASALLGVHENTIRYRLARVEETTGRDILSDSDDQLAVQLALLILRIEGRLPSLRLESEAGEPESEARRADDDA